jgi:DNA-binding winged helix-turn-helix (wHTH) protein/tetratricopeptide (TPR) repeat protein
MKYQIDNFVLDTQARTLSTLDHCQNIRPKTLALLLFLANRVGQVISKQELLDKVWNDVHVDDGVVFQSIREIRQLFSNPQVIQNHPRKGYEFTFSFSEIKANEPNKLAKHSVLKYLVLAVSISFIVIIALLAFFSRETNTDIKYQESIAVLPIKNYVPYAEHDWVYLGGMEHLIAKLKGLPSTVFVYEGTYIPRLMHLAGLTRDYNVNDIGNIFDVSGATLIVEAQVHGNVYDYKLVYKFHVANDVKQGVILDTTINGALTTLSEKLALYIKHPLQSHKNVPMKEFSDALFAEAMISYESSWLISISFFESYLVLNPDSVIALIYLSKLYLWNDELEQASKLMERASQLIKHAPQETAHVTFITGRIAAQKKDWQLAMQLYDQAASLLDKHTDWFLKASIAEEQGLAYLEQEQLIKSSQAFNRALSFYQIIQSPIGINSSKLHLAHVLLLQGNITEAKNTYLQAKESINDANLEFLYSMLETYEEKFSQQFSQQFE